MKVFVTGATGFVGGHFVEQLIASGHEAHCLVRKTSNIKRLIELGASLHYGDVTDKQSLLNGMKGCNWAVHLANLYSYWEPDIKVYTEINVSGTRNVMEAALEAKLEKIAHISSIIVFGNHENELINEESEMGCELNTEYARTKYAADLVAWEFHKKKDLPLVILYPVAVIGPGDTKPTGQYLKNLVAGKLPSLTFCDTVFTFVHVKDVARAIVKALEKENNIGEKYIVGKHQMKYGDYSRLICEVAGAPVPKNEMSSSLTGALAKIFTGIAGITKKPPKWDLSTDAVKMLTVNFRADGSKAERELGITYTPIRSTLEEAVKEIK